MKDHFFCMNSENWLLQLASRHDTNRSVGEALYISNISTWCFSFTVSAYSSNLVCDQEDAGAGLVTSLLFWGSNLFNEWGLTANKCKRKIVPVWAKKAYSMSSGTVHNYHDIIFCPWLFGSMTTLAKWKLHAAENIMNKKRFNVWSLLNKTSGVFILLLYLNFKFTNKFKLNNESVFQTYLPTCYTTHCIQFLYILAMDLQKFHFMFQRHLTNVTE